MDGIVGDTDAELSTERVVSGLGGIGGANKVTEPLNGLGGFKGTEDDRAGRAECDEMVEVRSAGMLLIQRTGLFAIQGHHSERAESESVLFANSEDRTDVLMLHGIGFEHGKGAFHGASFSDMVWRSTRSHGVSLLTKESCRSGGLAECAIEPPVKSRIVLD